jgi:WD40-like Beta Propeller Repeat
MSGQPDLLDRAVDLFPAPDQALERLKRRRDRRQRNRKIAAGGLGLAIALAIVVGIMRLDRSTAPMPAEPSATPKVNTTVEDGRILFVMLKDNVSVPAYIDDTGLHEIGSFQAATFFHVVWASPTEIIYDGRGTGERHIYRMPIDGGDPVQLTGGTTSQERAGVAPDGSQIVYDRYDEATLRDLGLHIADAATGLDARPLLLPGDRDHPGFDSYGTFSPDGRWIAFTRVIDEDQGLAGLFIVRTDGTGLRRLVEDSFEATYPRWSPDGSRILFTRGGDVAELYTVSVDGGDPSSVTGHGADGGATFEGDWSPDGTQIVFKYWESWMKHNELRIVDADGNNERILWSGSENGTSAETPDWGL